MKLVSDYVVHALVQDRLILILILDIAKYPDKIKLNHYNSAVNHFENLENFEDKYSHFFISTHRLDLR